MVEVVKEVVRATYARLSRDLGKLSENVNTQIQEARDHFTDRDWPIDETLIFHDNDISASTFSTKPRPGYNELLDAIRAGRVMVVVVTEVSRLCRNLADAIEVIALAKQTSFTTVETTAGVRYDLTSIQGEHDFLEAVLDASRESGKLSVRTRRTKRVRAKQGMFNGGIRPYGYAKPEGGEKGELAVVEAEAAIVREVVARVLAGEAVQALAKELNTRGIPSATGRRWHPATLRQLLHSPMIKGVRVHHGTEYPATWPALISSEDFERIQVVLSDAARYVGADRKGARSYLLTGFIVCGAAGEEAICGAKLIGGAAKCTGESMAKRRYACRRFDQSGLEVGCGKLLRLADPVELIVSESVLARYSSDDLSALLSPEAPEELYELAASLAEDKVRLDEATHDRYRRKGDPLRLEPGRYAAIRAEVEEAMEMTRRRMARLEQGKILAEIPLGMTLRQAWDAADLNWRRTILSLVVAKVILYPGFPGRRVWPAADSPLLERAKSLGGPWCFDPSKVDIEWKA